jgi:predicted ATPase
MNYEKNRKYLMKFIFYILVGAILLMNQVNSVEKLQNSSVAQMMTRMTTVNRVTEIHNSIEISDLIKPASSDIQQVDRKQQRYILTGGPGAGKTSIINFLAKKGYSIVPEAATEIIEQDLRKGVEKPWLADDYHIRMYQLISKRQVEIENSMASVVFFDRGHLDGLSYILLQKCTLYQCILDHVQTSIDTQYFNKKVFFIDSLGFVVPGPARNEDLQESLLKASCLKRNYEAMGYEVIHIPPGSIEERAQLIIDHIAKETE